jgi:hypothetical protein
MASDEVVTPAVEETVDTLDDTVHETGDERVDETVEALRAVARAAVEVGRQVLDAVEKALDDPATADKLAEVVAGFSRLTEGMRPRSDDQDAAADGGLERIEVT